MNGNGGATPAKNTSTEIGRDIREGRRTVKGSSEKDMGVG